MARPVPNSNRLVGSGTSGCVLPLPEPDPVLVNVPPPGEKMELGLLNAARMFPSTLLKTAGNPAPTNVSLKIHVRLPAAPIGVPAALSVWRQMEAPEPLAVH